MPTRAESADPIGHRSRSVWSLEWTGEACSSGVSANARPSRHPELLREPRVSPLPLLQLGALGMRRFYASFRYQAQSWSRARRVVAKVEWHPGELYPRVGFIVTNLRRSAGRVIAFYNGRGRAEQWIKEGKHAIKWTRLSCTTFRANAVRLQLHALAYNLANFLRTLALPGEIAQWSLTSVWEKVVKIGAKVVGHGRYAIFQMAEVAVPRELFGRLLDRIARLRPPDRAPC